MQKIVNCLWFDTQAEEAARFYTKIFKKSKIKKVTYYPKATEHVSGKTKGTVMTVLFTIEGHDFLALNGGTHFTFSPAISFMIHGKTQKEMDHYWNKLIEGGGKPSRCGWLEDKFGVSWQITPADLPKFLKTPAQTERVMAEILKMDKIDLAAIKRAAGKPGNN